ncbi:MAG TPA: isoaspartyl peptidase/L-asparaginase [Pyrinomonadaceae bacterium]|nr:isoaspartyl peptidase/L-asparaginase [Pyrinomonadaceae bacterium]
MTKIALAIHGGAGTISKSEMTAELEKEYRNGLKNALRTGWEILSKNGSALDAVEAAVVELENFPLFNAGRGAVFTHEGKNELDASIMNGKNLRAGSVAFVKNVKNPIKLARLVMEKTEHIMLGGEGANEFAREMKVELAPDEYFFTEHRYLQLTKAIEAGRIQLDHASDDVSDSKFQIPNSDNQKPKTKDQKPFGTVGAVACDFSGNLAAATSTGGMTNKKFGRIGDTPIVGAGTYAENATCAVSCTGHGEFFMLGATAFDVSARMKYQNLSLEQAANEAINYQTEIGGEGGLIAVDNSGNVALPFNSDGMYRGFVTANGNFKVEIYR